MIQVLPVAIVMLEISYLNLAYNARIRDEDSYLLR